MIRNALLVTAVSALCAGSIAAQCSLEANRQWNAPAHTTVEDVALARSFVFEHSEPWPVEVCSIAVITRNNGCSSARFHIEVRADSAGQPGTVTIGRGPSLAIPAVAGIVDSPLTNVVLQPNTRYHVVMDYENTNGCGTFGSNRVHRPAAAATAGGPLTESWILTQQSGVTFWLRSDDRIRYRVRYEPHVRATSQNFGATCGISAPCSTTPFQSHNDNGNPLLGRRSAGPIAFRVRDNFGYPTRYVCGLDLRIGASTPTSVRVSILDELQALPGQRITETTLAIPPGPAQSRHVSFSAPARIAAGSNYWVSIESLGGQVALPIEAFGQPVAEATFDGLGWVSGGANDSWSYRTFVTTNVPMVPTLDSDVPLLGASFDVDLDDGPRNGLAFLLIGFQNPDLDLASYGAPGCYAVASGEYTWLVPVDGAGRASHSVAVPQNLNLLGLRFYSQYAPLVPANRLGAIFTNGAVNRIGTF